MRKIKEIITVEELKNAIESRGFIFFNETEDKERLIEIYKDSLSLN